MKRLLGAALCALPLNFAFAAADSTEIQGLRAQIAALRAEQTRQIEQIRADTDARIAAIEAAMTLVTGPAPASVKASPVLATTASTPKSPLQWSADFRLRYEGNFGDDESPARNRGVLRARLGARYEISNWLSVGARLATGDPDDPNSTDVTLSDFDDDLAVSLDQAYLRVQREGFDIHGGKIPNPFTRTELVWDGDVNPEGASVSWSAALPAGITGRLTGGYFLVQEQAAGPDADMNALQASLIFAAAGWKYELAAAYYDYDILTLAGSDSGDTRTNLLAPGGARYLSDFDLFDVVASASSTASRRWPARIVANYVKNRGAAVDADTGYEFDVFLGRTAQTGDLRFSYGYAVAEADAVLAAFAQDNLTLGSNYRQHALGIDYALAPKTSLNLTLYRYRYDQPALAPGATDEWLNRVRLNLLLQL